MESAFDSQHSYEFHILKNTQRMMNVLSGVHGQVAPSLEQQAHLDQYSAVDFCQHVLIRFSSFLLHTPICYV